MMDMPMCKTSINSKKLQYGDLPPIKLITGKAWKPSEREFLQWSTSYPDADLAGELPALKNGFRNILTGAKQSAACIPS